MIRRTIPKHIRQQVYEKYGGHCAYCGKALEYKEMQVDHMIPLRSGGADNMENYMPACRRCNHYKRGSSLETFRRMIEKIPEKLQRDSYIFKVGVDYGFFEAWDRSVTFYFESYKSPKEESDPMDKFWAEQLLRGMQYSESSLTKGRKKVPEMDWNVGPKTKEAIIRIIGMKKLEDGDE